MIPEKRKKIFQSLQLLLLSLLLAFFSTTLPAQYTNLNFEGAQALQPGQFEFALNFGSVYETYSGNTERALYRPATFLRVGVHKQIDLKISYDRLFRNNWENGFNLVQFGPKFSTKNQRFAIRLPLGIYFQKYQYTSEGESNYDTFYAFSPRVIITALKKSVVELNVIPYGEFLFDKGSPGSSLLGLNIGLGFSNNFDVWSIRPEGGIEFPLAESSEYYLWSFGISGSYIIGSKKK